MCARRRISDPHSELAHASVVLLLAAQITINLLAFWRSKTNLPIRKEGWPPRASLEASDTAQSRVSQTTLATLCFFIRQTVHFVRRFFCATFCLHAVLRANDLSMARQAHIRSCLSHMILGCSTILGLLGVGLVMLI